MSPHHPYPGLPRKPGSDQDTAFAIGDEEPEKGLRLICIGSPLSDVVLDAWIQRLRQSTRDHPVIGLRNFLASFSIG